MASPSPGERNGERTGRMDDMAVKGVDEIKLKELFSCYNQKGPKY